MQAHEHTATGTPSGTRRRHGRIRRTSARDWWEARYAAGTASGRVVWNAVLAAWHRRCRAVRAVGRWTSAGGRAATWCGSPSRAGPRPGVDLSDTAEERGRRAAAAAGVGERTSFVAADVATWAPDGDGRFDLVTASFLQSWPVEIPRAAILHRATGLVAEGGHLLVTAHAAPPHADLPEAFRTYRFPSPEEDLASLRLDDGWGFVVAEGRPRSATGPDGNGTTPSTAWCWCDAARSDPTSVRSGTVA